MRLEINGAIFFFREARSTRVSSRAFDPWCLLLFVSCRIYEKRFNAREERQTVVCDVQNAIYWRIAITKTHLAFGRRELFSQLGDLLSAVIQVDLRNVVRRGRNSGLRISGTQCSVTPIVSRCKCKHLFPFRFRAAALQKSARRQSHNCARRKFS